MDSEKTRIRALWLGAGTNGGILQGMTVWVNELQPILEFPSFHSRLQFSPKFNFHTADRTLFLKFKFNHICPLVKALLHLTLSPYKNATLSLEMPGSGFHLTHLPLLPGSTSPNAWSSFLPQRFGRCPFFFSVFSSSTLLPTPPSLFSWLTPFRLCEFARAARIKHHKLRGEYTVPELSLDTRRTRSRHRQSSAPSEGPGRGLLHASFLASDGSITSVPWLVDALPQFPPSCSQGILPVHIHLRISTFHRTPVVLD